MPMRYLKPEVRDSETINRLSDQAEALWYRLLVTVDDYGRFDARPSLVKSQCYPIKESVTAADCNRLLAELDAKGAIIAYFVDGKPFLQMAKWTNTPRAAKSKFPPFTGSCTRVYADADGTLAPAPAPSPARQEALQRSRTPAREQLPPGFSRFWEAWPRNIRKEARGRCLEAWRRHGFEQIADTIVAHVAFLAASAQWQKNGGEFVPAPLVYLNGRRWEGFEGQEAGSTPEAAWAGGV